MDIRSYLGASSLDVIEDSSASDSDDAEPPPPSPPPPPPKRLCITTKVGSGKRKYSKSWEKYTMMRCKQSGRSLEHTKGVWVTKPFKNWKKAIEKMKAHSKSESHHQAAEYALLARSSGTILAQLQNVESHERAKNRAAIKSLIRCTHFLTREHVAFSTKFEKLVDLVVSCGSHDLKIFLENAPKNASYTSRVAVVEVDESIIDRLQKAYVFSLMADECTDISIVCILSLGRRWYTSRKFLRDCPIKKG